MAMARTVARSEFSGAGWRERVSEERTGEAKLQAQAIRRRWSRLDELRRRKELAGG
jgi:hypothetical protein